MKGFTTIHAGSARQALTRLRFVAQLADTSSELPLSALNSLVSEAVDVVVHCGRVRDVPRVTEIHTVEDLQTGADSSSFTTTELFSRTRHDAPLTWTGNLPVRCGRAFDEAGFDLRTLLDTGARPIEEPLAAARARADGGGG